MGLAYAVEGLEESISFWKKRNKKLLIPKHFVAGSLA
jgi:hypothetical protein